MKLDRRQWLLGAASLAACKGTATSDTPTDLPPPTPSPARDPSPEPHEAAGTADQTVFPWGVWVGDPLPDAVEVRARSTSPTFELIWLTFEGGGWQEMGRATVTSDEATASHRIDGLEPGRAYCVYADDGSSHSKVTRFRTAPAAGVDQEVRIGASSCFGFTNPGINNLSHTVGADLDVFVQLGDYGYLDGSLTIEDYIALWSSYLERQAVRDMVSSTGQIHTWDDHEVSNNWTLEPGFDDSITAAQLEAAVTVWRQIMPMGPGLGGSGVWRSLKWGDVAEFFVLDCRGERDGAVMSEEQLQWFEDAMAASTAAFKVVLSSVHMTDHTELFGFVQELDRWQGHPAQRAHMVAVCANTPGTFVLTGDMHFGAVMRVDPVGVGENLWEIAAGPSGSRLVPMDQIIEVTGKPDHYDVLLEAWSWCDIRMNAGTMTVVVDFIGDDGSVLESRELQL